MKLLMLAIILSIVIVLSLGLFIRKQLSVTATMNRYINAYVEQGKFSGVVLVAKNGKVLLSKGYGMANYELDVPNMPQTTFRIGSVTKQFTAMPIIQLLDKLSLKNGLDTPVSEYVPDYPQGNKITLYHLLNHKSGIPNYTSFEEYPDKATRPVSLEKHIEFFKYKPLNFEPGEKYEYSNSNYVLLAYIIEKATGMPYEIYLQKFIFQPLNMSNSGCTDNKSPQKNKASGYSVSIEGIINAQYEDPSWLTGDGGIYATVEDLYKWDRALYTEKLASKETLNTIFKSLKADPIKDEYAYGWVLDSWNGHPLMWHNGRISGFRSFIGRFIKDNICIIVLSNFDFAPVEKIAYGLAQILFGMPYELPIKQSAVKIDLTIYDFYVGKYELNPNLILTVTKEDNHLLAQVTGQNKFEIFPESEFKFFYKVIDAQITFVKDEQGNIVKLILHQGGKDTPAKKIK